MKTKRMYVSLLTVLLTILCGNKLNAQQAWDGKSHNVGWYTNNPDKSEFVIISGSDLAGLFDLVNEKHITFAGKTIKLSNNINLGGLAWTPIGKYINELKTSYPFEGIFDGNGKTISGLTIDGNKVISEAVGLFGFISGDAVIKDLTLSDVNIKGKGNTGFDVNVSYTGSLVGYAYGSNEILQIHGCYAEKGKVEGGRSSSYSYTGGLTGCLIGNCQISRSGNNLAVTGGVAIGGTVVNNGSSYTGGLTGLVFSTGNSELSECYNAGTIKGGNAKNYSGTGGLIGSGGGMSGTFVILRNSYSDAIVTAAPKANKIYAGGLAGWLTSSGLLGLMNCYAAGTIIGEAQAFLGGLCGKVEENVEIYNCLALPATGGDKYSSEWSGPLTAVPIREWNGSSVWLKAEDHKVMPQLKEMKIKQAAIANPLVGIPCDVTFDTQGGSEVAKLINVPFGTRLSWPVNPTRDKHLFAGWYTDSLYTKIWDFDIDVTGAYDITLYSKWIFEPDPIYAKLTMEIATNDSLLRDCMTLYPITQGEHTVQVGKRITCLVFLSNYCELSDVRLIANGDTIIAEEKKHELLSTAYTFSIPVEGETKVKAIGLKWNNSIGIELEKAKDTHIFVNDTRLFVETKQPGDLRVYTIAGQLYTSKYINTGTTILPLPKGIYMVAFGDTVVKISIGLTN